MFREFADSSDLASKLSHDDVDWQYNRMVLIGEMEWVKGMIHRLHVVGVAEVSTWSRIMPTGKPGEVISTLLRSKQLR